MRRLLISALSCTLLIPAVAEARTAEGKPVVAVAEFSNSTGQPVDVGRGLQDKMHRALEESGKVVVVERLRLDKVIEEQRLGLTGLVDPETAARVGELTGADFLVAGNLDQFDYQESSLPFGAIIGGIAGIEGTEGIGHRSFSITVGVTISIIDANTGQSQRAAGAATRKGGGLGFDIYNPSGIGWGQLNRGIVGEAIHEAINRAVRGVLREVFVPHVIKRSGLEIFIDEGANDRVRVGDRYRVLAEETLPGGHVITDQVGVLEVERVWETASRCRILEGADRIEPGQRVGFIRPPRPPAPEKKRTARRREKRN